MGNTISYKLLFLEAHLTKYIQTMKICKQNKARTHTVRSNKTLDQFCHTFAIRPIAITPFFIINEKSRSTIQYNEKKKKKKKKEKKKERETQSRKKKKKKKKKKKRKKREKPSPKTCFYRKRNARMSSGFRVIIFDL